MALCAASAPLRFGAADRPPPALSPNFRRPAPPKAQSPTPRRGSPVLLRGAPSPQTIIAEPGACQATLARQLSSPPRMLCRAVGRLDLHGDNGRRDNRHAALFCFCLLPLRAYLRTGPLPSPCHTFTRLPTPHAPTPPHAFPPSHAFPRLPAPLARRTCLPARPACVLVCLLASRMSAVPLGAGRGTRGELGRLRWRPDFLPGGTPCHTHAHACRASARVRGSRMRPPRASHVAGLGRPGYAISWASTRVR